MITGESLMVCDAVSECQLDVFNIPFVYYDLCRSHFVSKQYQHSALAGGYGYWMIEDPGP